MVEMMLFMTSKKNTCLQSSGQVRQYVAKVSRVAIARSISSIFGYCLTIVLEEVSNEKSKYRFICISFEGQKSHKLIGLYW